MLLVRLKKCEKFLFKGIGSMSHIVWKKCIRFLMTLSIPLFLFTISPLSLVKKQKIFHEAMSQEIPLKGKVLLSMAGYGTMGGALLGLASLAFGTNSRSVAIGASVGLYAGLLFGGYIVLSHQYQKKFGGQEEDPTVDSPYGVEGEPGLGEPLDEVPEGADAQRWDLRPMFDELRRMERPRLRAFHHHHHVPIYVNLITLQF